MRMHVSADIPLSEPNASSGLVTWFSIDIFPDDDAPSPRIGHARVARIHISSALDLNVPLLGGTGFTAGSARRHVPPRPWCR
jgi:hypothetical protein